MRYFLDTDQSGHWYLVPVDRFDEWMLWDGLPEDDPAAWSVPDWVRAVDGSPTRVTFENPVIE